MGCGIERRLGVLWIVISLAVISETGASAQFTLSGNVVEIVAGDYFLQAPDTIAAGLTTFNLRLHSGGHAVQVVKLDDGKTVSDFVESWKMRTPRPWAHVLGGPGYPSQKRPANATLILEPGHYVLADILNEAKYDGTGHLSKGMYRALTVVPSSSSASVEPTPDIVVRVTDSSFEFSKPLTAGMHTLRVENAGTTHHEFKVRRVLPGKTTADVRSWGRRSGSPEPAELWGGLAGFPAGRHLTTTIDFLPGDYVITSCCGTSQPPLKAITVPAPQPDPSGDDPIPHRDATPGRSATQAPVSLERIAINVTGSRPEVSREACSPFVSKRASATGSRMGMVATRAWW